MPRERRDIAKLRESTDDTYGTCDWGRCDRPTYAERFDWESSRWLAVCRTHAGKRGMEGETDE